VVGYRGQFVFNTSRPDGMPRKVMDVGRLAALGWTARTPFRDGMVQAYDWFVRNAAEAA
jgi:GDP-L-fucose synthase